MRSLFIWILMRNRVCISGNCSMIAELYIQQSERLEERTNTLLEENYDLVDRNARLAEIVLYENEPEKERKAHCKEIKKNNRKVNRILREVKQCNAKRERIQQKAADIFKEVNYLFEKIEDNIKELSRQN